MNTDTSSISTIRLYGGAIAIVSGIYSGYIATTSIEMTLAAWGMLLLGGIVFIHGIVLLLPLASRLGGASGPLMIGYSVLMLLNQAWMAARTQRGTGMAEMTNGMMGQPMYTEFGMDPGMVAIAILMLVSGLIMTRRRNMMLS